MRKPACDGCPLQGGCRARSETLSTGWPRFERKAPAYRYEDSNRYYRGRVLAVLREESRAGGEGLALRDLGRRVKQGFDEGDAGWLHAAVESLCKDGLVRVSPTPGAVEVPGVVAEERAIYGIEREQRSPERRSSGVRSLKQRVSLP